MVSMLSIVVRLQENASLTGIQIISNIAEVIDE